MEIINREQESKKKNKLNKLEAIKKAHSSNQAATNRRFNTALTTDRHQSCPEPVESNPHPPSQFL
jgi:hypothetical protein